MIVPSKKICRSNFSLSASLRVREIDSEQPKIRILVREARRLESVVMMKNAACFFSFGKLSELGDSQALDLADPDGDGLVNFAEYGLVTSPTVPSLAPSADRFDYPGEGQRLRMFFTRDPARNDITIEVRAASAVTGPWMTIATSSLGGVTTGPGYVAGDDAGPGLKMVEVRDTVNIDKGTQQFLRIRFAP